MAEATVAQMKELGEAQRCFSTTKNVYRFGMDEITLRLQ